MKSRLNSITSVFPQAQVYHISMLLFRVLVSLQLMLAHGLKKIGIGVSVAEQVPNPLHLPEMFNQLFAVASNLFFPLLVMIGLFVRIAVLPILAVTLTGYFMVHSGDSLLQKDMPYMYSLAYLLILMLGPGKYSADHLLYQKNRKAFK
ncbi:MAG: DoxX family protein [Bacteroidetes bacterium]|nr:DoxX family protein [Bacteroidota bacterium]